MGSLQFIPGTEQVSGRKQTEAGQQISPCVRYGKSSVCTFKHGCV